MSDLLTRPIPSTGERLPSVGLGTWQAFDFRPGGAEAGEAREAIATLVREGGRLVDSSPMYGQAEARIGEATAGLRDRLFLATKVWTRGREAGEAQMRASLQKMGADVMDLLQVHNLLDVETHLATLARWKAEGQVRYVGVTHYTAAAQPEVERVLRAHRPDFVQINFSVVEPEAEARLLPAAADLGVAVLANRPFGGGDLAKRLRQRALPPVAAELDCTSWGQLLLKWVLANPAVTCAIPGTRNPVHVADNLAAARGPLPDAGQRRAISEAVGRA